MSTEQLTLDDLTPPQGEPSDDPRAVVEESDVSRTLEEVLDAIEQQDAVLHLQQRLGAPNMATTRRILRRLDVPEGPNGDLSGQETQDAVETLREGVNS